MSSKRPAKPVDDRPRRGRSRGPGPLGRSDSSCCGACFIDIVSERREQKPRNGSSIEPHFLEGSLPKGRGDRFGSRRNPRGRYDPPVPGAPPVQAGEGRYFGFSNPDRHVRPRAARGREDRAHRDRLSLPRGGPAACGQARACAAQSPRLHRAPHTGQRCAERDHRGGRQRNGWTHLRVNTAACELWHGPLRLRASQARASCRRCSRRADRRRRASKRPPAS